MPAKSWFHAKARGNGAADIAIFSDIGGFGVSAQDFHDQLLALGDVTELNISISSDGGDVFVGFAIFNMLRRHPANKIVTVEGLAASMASVITMAGDEVVMPSNAMLMIHNPWGGVVGESDQIISFGEALDKMRKGILKAYRDRTGIKPSELQAMMDRETWLDATESVALGFADRIEKPIAMAASFNLDRFSNVPTSFGQTIGSRNMTAKTNEKVAEVVKTEGESVAVKTEAEIRAELVTRQKEIRSLCKLAGMPELADGFVDEDKSTAEVIAALDTESEKRAKTKPGGKKPVSAEVSARNANASEDQPKLDTVAIYERWNSAGRNRAA